MNPTAHSAASRRAHARLWTLGSFGDQLGLDLGPERQPIRRERRAKCCELAEGESLVGCVLKTPRPGEPHGNYLILETTSGPIALAASGKSGATVLGRELDRQQVRVGDEVAITYLGMRATRDGERRYRAFAVEVEPNSSYLRYERARGEAA